MPMSDCFWMLFVAISHSSSAERRLSNPGYGAISSSALGSRRLKVNPYSAGTKGPAQAELLIGRDGRSWNE